MDAVDSLSSMSSVPSHNEVYHLDNGASRNEMNISTTKTSNEDMVIQHHESGNNAKPQNDFNNNTSSSKESEEERNESMTIEERHIHESILHEREKAHAKLQATLDRVRETTRAMLNEIDVFLESTENVMVDYTKCQNSQMNEARRLEEVEPDVVGATERYLQQVQGMIQ